jgi:DNA-binding response OmpR family regulator
MKVSPTEFNILYLLASNPGKVFSTDEIFENVWHGENFGAAGAVMTHIKRLRVNIKDNEREDKIITTVWGVGYKIEK